MLAVLACIAGSCAPDPVDGSSTDRSQRYGIFRDLTLFARPVAQGGPFFLDRFESTQADWRSYLASERPSRAALVDFRAWNDVADDSLPVVGMDLAEAGRFARWRFGRLPRADEWRYAATAGGRYRLPWGDVARSAWANSQALRLAGLTPVGTFESGRKRPDGPYDLVGNAAEWTTSIAPGWITPTRPVGSFAGGLSQFIERVKVIEAHPALWPWSTPGAPVPLAFVLAVGPIGAGGYWAGDVPEFAARLRTALAHPALRPWILGSAPVPLAWLLEVDSLAVPRLAVGGFERPMSGAHLAPPHFWSGDPQVRRIEPEVRSQYVGVRVAGDPEGVLRALLRESEPPPAAGLALLLRFLREPEHLRVLREALGRHREWLRGAGPLGPILERELAP